MFQKVSNSYPEKECYTLTAKELIKMAGEEIACLVEPIFPRVGLVAISGSSDTGKSTLMRQLCINITAGDKDFIGYELKPKHKRALYVSTEDDKYAISTLLSKQYIGLTCPESNRDNLHYVFDTTDLLGKVTEILEKTPFDVIVIDAFADVFGKDINQTNQVRNFLNDYSQIAARFECLVVFIHHTGKASEYKAPSKNSLLGSQGFEAKMRTVAMLTKSKANAQLRYFCLVKGNYLPEKCKNEAKELTFNENMIFTPTGNVELLENLSEDENKKFKREEAIRLQQLGASQKEIATKLGLSQSTVSRILSNSSAC